MPDGSLKVRAHLARTGIQNYTYSDGRLVREYRDPKEVFSETTLDSFRGASLTVQHPTSKVHPKSWRGVTVGHVAEDVRQDGELMAATLYIKDQDAIERVKSGELVELSCGYECEMVPESGKTDTGEEFDAKQTRIIGNHVALGPANWGRAGRNVRLYLDDGETAILDVATSIEDSMTKEQEAKAAADKKAADEAQALADKKLADEAAAAEAAKVVVPPAPLEAPVAPVLETPQVKGPGNIDSVDAVKVDSLVDERLEVVATARRIVGDSFDHKGKTNAQIMAEVVAAKLPNLKLDGRDPSYVQSRFDSLAEAQVKQDEADQVLGATRVAAGNPVPKKDQAEDARTRMIAEGLNAWKRGTK